jgi:hypothetical protein
LSGISLLTAVLPGQERNGLSSFRSFSFYKTEGFSGIDANTIHQLEMARGFAMGKKNKDENISFVKKGKKGRIPFNFLNEQFDNIDTTVVKTHIFYIILVSVMTKFVVLFLTTTVFHSFIDLFDFQYYVEHGTMVVNGQVPYLDFAFDYPPLALIPILLAMIPAILTMNQYAFVYSFQALMVICDIFTALCVYFIGLKIYNEKKAFLAALIYSAAFSTAYFVLTKYDAFPTCLLMIAVLFTIYGMNMRGYLADTAGALAKIYPLIALPFIVLYNAKITSLKEEIVQVLKIFIPLFLLVALPILVVKPEIISQYFSASLVRDTVYVNTPTYVLYSVLHELLNIDISTALISNLMYAVMGIILLLLIFIAFKMEKINQIDLLKLLVLSIFSVVFFMKYHSPQYLVWYTPIVCLLVADRMYAVALFFSAQVITYIEFPLLFGVFYTNVEYLNPVNSAGYFLTVGFFGLEYLVLILLIFVAVNPSVKNLKKFFMSKTG